MQFFYNPGRTTGSSLSLSNIEIHFTCDIKPLTPLPYRSGRTSPRPIRIMAVMLYVDLPGSSFVKRERERESIRLAFDFPAFRKTVERYCIIHVVVFAFESFDVLKSVVREHPMLTEPLAHAEQRVYRFAYKRANPAPLMPPEGYAYHTWVLVDPITMEPTGVLSRLVFLSSGLTCIVYSRRGNGASRTYTCDVRKIITGRIARY